MINAIEPTGTPLSPDLSSDQCQHPQENKKYHTNVKDSLRKIDSGPSVHHTVDPKRVKQIPVDLVEEESMESFPASDPPGHHRSRSDQPEPRRPGDIN